MSEKDMLRMQGSPELRFARTRPTDVTAEQRKRLAAVTAVLMLLTAGLIALSLSAAVPTTGRLLSNPAQHHLTVPSPVRSFSFSQHGTPAVDAALVGPGVLLGLGLLVWLRRRPESGRLTLAAVARPSARAPPRGH